MYDTLPGPGDGSSHQPFQAGSWDRPRRVVFKAELLEKGPNTRFVVTSRPNEPLALYDWYVDGGEPENWIKDFKNALAAERLSCHRFWANAFRLMLHAAAYWLMDVLRRWLAPTEAARYQFDTLRLRLLKIGGRVLLRARGVRLSLAAGHPGEPLWRHLVTRSARPVNNGTLLISANRSERGIAEPVGLLILRVLRA